MTERNVNVTADTISASISVGSAHKHEVLPAAEGVDACNARDALLAMHDGDVIVFDDGIIVERTGNEWEVDCPDD